eukprot:scaffold214196_cov36-Tisochrysis_lutea.AAC.1
MGLEGQFKYTTLLHCLILLHRSVCALAQERAGGEERSHREIFAKKKKRGSGARGLRRVVLSSQGQWDTQESRDPECETVRPEPPARYLSIKPPP